MFIFNPPGNVRKTGVEDTASRPRFRTAQRPGAVKVIKFAKMKSVFRTPNQFFQKLTVQKRCQYPDTLHINVFPAKL